MLKELVAYLQNNRDKIIKTKTEQISNNDSDVSSSGTWYPSTLEEVTTEEFDFDELLNQIDKFSKTFKEN